jgi:hypothetical protein
MNPIELAEMVEKWGNQLESKDIKEIAKTLRTLHEEAKARLIRIMGTFDLATGHADTFDELLDSLELELRDVLGHYREAYNRKNNANLKAPAPNPKTDADKGRKASFCARMGGVVAKS